MSQQDIINRIIEKEWTMFHAVNGDGPKADCQNDRPTFVGMRGAQFSAWDEATCASYLDDVTKAEACGRNLCAEKYIHMMRYTAILDYEKLKDQLTFPDERGMELVDSIAKKMIEQTVSLFKDYPYVAGSGRPLYSSQDFGGVTSIETYQKGELMTYSTATLEKLYAHLLKLEGEGILLAKNIMENSVCFYGYANIDEAEDFAKRDAEAMGFEITYGCANCTNPDDCGGGCEDCEGECEGCEDGGANG